MTYKSQNLVQKEKNFFKIFLCEKENYFDLNKNQDPKIPSCIEFLCLNFQI